MAQLSYRENTLLSVNSTDSTRPDFAGSYDVTAYPVGAIASAASTDTTIPVDAGHSFRVGDKILNITGLVFSGTNTVASVTATQITMDSNFTVVSGDDLVNLGVDTGTSSPNYDASPLPIYSDADGSTAVSNSRVTCSAAGEYSYYHKGDGRFWELVRDSSATVTDVIKGFGASPRFNVCDFGAAGDGTTNDRNAIQAAIDACISVGGGTVYFPQSTYVCNSDVDIGRLAKNVMIDLGGSIIKTATASIQFVFSGDTGTDGDFSEAPSNCWIFNGQFGDASDTANQFLGPLFLFCVDCGARNLRKIGKGGTAYNIKNCKRIVMENCYTTGAGSGKFGFLLINSDNCVFDRCYMTDGAFLYGLQIKGGQSNRVHDCHIINQAAEVGFTDPTQGFRDRGDAPWGASVNTGTYPYSTGSYGASDVRRASRNTVFSDCSIVDSPLVVAYLTQESMGTRFTNCVGDNVEVLGLARSVSGGQERAYTFENLRGKDVGTSSGVTTGGIVVIGLSGLTLPGLRIKDCIIEELEGPGIDLDFCDQPRVTGCKILNPGQGVGGTTTQAGIYLQSCLRPVLIGNEAIDNQGSPTMTHGYRINEDNSTWPTLHGNFASGASGGSPSYDFLCFLPGSYEGNYPAEGNGQTTDATLDDTFWRCFVADNSAVYLDIMALAMESDGSNRAAYKAGGLFYRDGGSAAQQGADVFFMRGSSAAALTDSTGGSANQDVAAVTDQSETVDLSVINDNFAEVTDEINKLVTDATPDIESENWGGLGFSVVGNYVRVQVTGLAATTINWRIFVAAKEIL